MKSHYGLFEDYGDYEHPLRCCEKTLCGLTTEIPCENSTDDWIEVTCKKCLKLKNEYIEGLKSDEEAIVHQMGEMAEFLKNESQQFNINSGEKQ